MDRKQVPSLLARYIDPAWRLRSHGDHGLRRDLGGLLGQYLEQQRIAVTAMGDTLVIACRDRSCATELRFLQRDIRKTLDAAGHQGIDRVRVLLSGNHVSALPSAAPTTTTRRDIPPAARQALRSAAASISDSRLSEALRRLASAGLSANTDTLRAKSVASGTKTDGLPQGGRTPE